jgi:hypothetical protein
LVLKKITFNLVLSPEAIANLKAAHPTIIQKVYIMQGATVFFVDITPTQETQIRQVLMDTIIEIVPL